MSAAATATDNPPRLATERLTLEPLRAAHHYGGVRRMNGDERVMRYITGCAETPEETRAWLARVEDRWRNHGYSWWAILHHGDMVGAAALQHLEGDPTKPFEIGWRLAHLSSGRGYATEAARRLLEFAQSRGIPEVLAVAQPGNLRSLAVMDRLGMEPLGLQTHYQREVMTYRWPRNRGPAQTV